MNFDNIPVPQDIIPTFVLSAVHGGLDTDSFESQIAQFKAADDVFSSDFLTSTIVIQSSTSTSAYQSPFSGNLQMNVDGIDWTVEPWKVSGS